MKYLNKIAVGIFAATLGLMSMTSCEGGDMYDVNSPSWLQEKIDSIEKNKPVPSNDLPDGHEDVYTVGKTDYTSGWWADFSKYYVIPDGEVWNAVFNLNINPDAAYTYKNFALILCNDNDRGSNIEYGAIRFDNQPSGNSEWGDYIDRSCVESTLTFDTDTDDGIQQLGGRVILTIDRSDPNAFTVTMTNGTVTKTYKQKTPLVNLNDDPANTNIRAFLVPEGSYINFLQSNLEPIGGYTSALDKNPAAMSISGVPDEVLVGSTLEEICATITATVTFEELPDPQSVNIDQLYFYVEGDLNTPGECTLVAIYNKTFKGANCEKPVYALAKFNVVNELSAYTEKYVCPNPVILGAEDNSSGWWSAHTENIKVEPKQTAVVTFTNYSSSVSNWNNFVTVLCSADGSKEYAVVRADNYGWGDGYAACSTYSDAAADWATWLAAMDGAQVTEYITNNGDGTADIKAVMLGTDGVEYVQKYTGINKVDKDNMYFNFTVDGCHLVFDTMVGAEDNSTAWWGAHSRMIQVPAHTIYTMSFTNYSCGANNWNNYCVVLSRADNTEYAVVRSDNFGWGDSYAACSPATTATDWATWLAAMNGAKVDLTVINGGDGTVDIKAVAYGNDGMEYTQTYTSLSPIDKDNFYVRLTVDNSHIEFSPSVTQAKRNAILVGKRPAKKVRRW